MDESLLNFLFLIFFLIVELEFTMIATENPGFYNITDSSGGYVYPLIAQSMILKQALGCTYTYGGGCKRRKEESRLP